MMVVVARGVTSAGQLPPCTLGRDKTRRFQVFQDWLTQAETKMEFFGISDNKWRVAYIRLNAETIAYSFWIETTMY